MRLEGVDEAVSHPARREAVDVPRTAQARGRGAVAEGPRVGRELRRRDGHVCPHLRRLGVRGVEVDRCRAQLATDGMGAQALQRLGVHDQVGATHLIDGSHTFYRALARKPRAQGQSCLQGSQAKGR